MLEDIGQRITKTWNDNKGILVAELLDPGSTDLNENPFSWVPANLPLDEVTWRDLNNIPMCINVKDSYYRQLPRDIGENETFGQYTIRKEDPLTKDEPCSRLVKNSLRFLNSTKSQVYEDFDQAMIDAGVTSKQVIDVGEGSNEAREILFPVYIILRNMEYGHQDFTT